jgi:CheY-like chemotaxis protein
MAAIALTAYGRSEDRVKALSAGFQVHVGKPIEPSQLVSVVESLNRPELRLGSGSDA